MMATAGQKLGSLLIPLYLLAVLAGAVVGAAGGLAASAISLIQSVAEPEPWGNWGPASSALIPVFFGIPAGGVAALAPATGAMVGLFVQAWNIPYPTTTQQSLTAGIGAGVASALLAALLVLHGSGSRGALLLVGAAFVLVSFFLTCRITARYLRHRESKSGSATHSTAG